MTKSEAKKKLKPQSKAGVPHLFMHHCASGNVIHARLSVPRPGHRSQFDAGWLWKPIEADLRE
jgi:hypothetical protein